MKQNLLSIGKLIQKGYIAYMEDNHCVIKDIHPSNQLIEKLPMTSNLFFPLCRSLAMKGKTNSRVAFKEESKEVDKHFDKEEKDSVEI